MNTSRSLVRGAVTLALLVLVSGCDKKEAPAADATAASASAAVANAAPSAAPQPIADTELAVSEDFEDVAEKQIADKDYKTALDGIEKELAAPTAP